MNSSREYGHHGSTPAAWTAVTLVMVGFTIGTLAVVLSNWWLFWILGVGLVVAGGIAGRVMSMMGMGMPEESETG